MGTLPTDVMIIIYRTCILLISSSYKVHQKINIILYITKSCCSVFGVATCRMLDAISQLLSHACSDHTSRE